MSARNHPSYQEENERCRYTLDYVDKSLTAMMEQKDRIDRTLERVKKHFNGENSQDYIDIIINTALQENAGLKLRNLMAAKSKPYFSRVDFKEKNKSTIEKLYIGKMALMRDEDQELIIVDWRAPVANLYYEGRLGEAYYDCPEGRITGELRLKRQFTINKGILEEIQDIDITTSDEFLQSYLGASADNRLKDIVTTIQAEQNRIIRADMWKPLIVQGAAGSGKTTIALHRIAYLAYNHEKSFKPENFMIVAPSKLFLNYISEVLPELGVDRVKQTTFEEFAMEIIGKKCKIKDAYEKLNAFVNRNATEEQVKSNRLLLRASELKSSVAFKEIMDDYLSHIEEAFIPKEDFVFAGRTIYKYEEINKLFLNDYKRWPIAVRVQEISKHLASRLKQQKESIINAFEYECDRKVNIIKAAVGDIEERREEIIRLIDEKEEKVKKIDSLAKKAVNEYTKKISKLSPLQYYSDFITNRGLFEALMEKRVKDRELVNFAYETWSSIFKAGWIEIEDLAPIIYLKFCIYGMDEKIPVKHIVIDEAQDFSVFQLYVLRKIIKDSSFTILGDLCQGIHSYRGTKDWEDMRNFVFEDVKTEFLLLEQSYRTTVEIMEAANKVSRRLKDGERFAVRPVIRHGEKVGLISKMGIRETAADIGEKVRECREKGLKSMAIICKSLHECKEVFTHLDKKLGAYILTGKEDEYRSGVVIVPSYLAKGLEFDVVFIANGSSTEYRENELDIKLLYVAMTRPLHRLYIYYSGEKSPLLEGI